MTTRIPRIGLVLGAGGIAGHAFHTAALGAIREMTGWDPRTAEIVVGTSAGSAVAAALRGNVPVTNLTERTLLIPTEPESIRVLRRISGREGLPIQLNIRPSSLGLVARELLRFHRVRPTRIMTGALPAGPLDNEAVGEAADELHGDDWPQAQTWIAAVDLDSGKLRVFGRGDAFAGRIQDGDTIAEDAAVATVGDAVRASSAIPGFFQPVLIDGRRYVDGGVHSASNAWLLANLGLDLVVICSPMSMSRFVPRSPLASASRVVPSMTLRSEIRAIRASGTEVLLVEPSDAVVRAVGPNPMDPTRIITILLESSAAVFEELGDSRLSRQRYLLRTAGHHLPSPADVPYPEVAV